MAPDTVPWWVTIAWPVFSGIVNVILRSRTPEEWIEINDRSPRRAAFTRFMRAVGWDPVKTVAAIAEFTAGGRQ